MKPEQREDDCIDTMWSMLQLGGIRANYPALKHACMELRQMMTQKTAGQRKDKPHDISFDNLERVKAEIIVEAMALVFSGNYEGQWINVKERLPALTERFVLDDIVSKTSKPVLVYDTTAETQVAILEDDGFWTNPHDCSEYYHVTHWMPLPAEPEEAEHEAD